MKWRHRLTAAGAALCLILGFLSAHQILARLLRDAISRQESLWLLGSGGVILIGIGLFLYYVNSTNRESLRQLREREAALERINEQTRRLAHHQRLETIGTLTSSIAHEFNNLLTPIMSYSLMTLEKLPPEEELYDNVLEIYNASQKAKVIISRLSDLSRKNSPRTFHRVCPDELVHKALDLAVSAKPRDVGVVLNLNCWDQSIRANELQICQMLLNLILNAFQAMPGGGRLEIHSTFDDHDVHLRLTDTGCGIPMELRKKIFDPFFTTKEPGKGTGLGLAIVAQVVQDHAGSIQVADAPQGGADFRIRLPRDFDAEA